MIRIKRAYEQASPKDGFRALVDRFWPRGLKKTEARIDIWARDAAPSPALCKWFGHDPDRWIEFEHRYRAELRAKPEGLNELLALARKHKTLTLVYSARDEEHNQAVALAKVLNGRRE
jgi:uncharacterized protein YeaO (DUF488 family)